MIPGDPDYPLGANPSFLDLIRRAGMSPSFETSSDGARIEPPHGTTILALRFTDGVVVAGDRRAVEGFSIADAKMEKVFRTDEHSAIAIAGVAGRAVELVKGFQTELEHYEKVEGERLSLEGKANRLARIVAASLPLAMQGLVVVPLFAGYDPRQGIGRLFRYDAIGGRYEDSDYHATGSGGRAAKGSLKKRWKEGLGREGAVEAAVEALLDAGEEDTATAGPDPIQGIYPTLFVITAEGTEEVPEEQVRAAFEALVERRRAG